MHYDHEIDEYCFTEDEARVIMNLENIFGINLTAENTLLEGYNAVKEKINHYEMQRL